MTGSGVHIPTLTTERLTLRAPGPQDLDAFADFFTTNGSAAVGGPLPRARVWRVLAEVIGHWTMRGYGRWMVTWTGRHDAVGLVGLHHPGDWPEPEIGWTVWGDALGQGVAQEAARAARSYAFDTLGWDTLISSCAPDNPRSARVAARIGARRDGAWTHPDFGPFDIWRHDRAAA